MTVPTPGAPVGRRRRPPAGVLAGGALFVAYALTLAPDVTFWDAGEFIAAAHSLGIPHPPGTPLFILLLHVWARALFFLPYAAATNLFSAASTAFAAAMVARLVHRSTGSWHMAVAAALAAGSMSSVWLNATETEVYAASLALGTLMVWAGDRAGRDDGERFVQLLAYLIVLAVPLHLSALVAAPAAIALAAQRPAGVDRRRVALLGGAFVLAMGVGRASWTLSAVGAAISLGSMLVPGTFRLSRRAALAIAAVAAGTLAASALAFLYVRAGFDPAINQGNPETWNALEHVIARRQYAVSPLWPREAPIWIQVANFGQYADWQAALSLGPTVMPSLLRTAGTLLFIVLAVEGLLHHFRTDRRVSTAVILLFLSGSLGVVAYLNMRAGPSIGWGVLPDNIMREARERDYFYVFAFWAWGLWAGIGAVAMARQYRRPPWAGILVAAIPLVLNWRAVTRRAEPERSLPRVAAEAMLHAAPRNAVLLVAGDNDSYPLWYAQQVLGLRRDVTVVTLPLLPTRWYRNEMLRRHRLFTDDEVVKYEPMFGTSMQVVNGAQRNGRPVAASFMLTPRERDFLGDDWQASGLLYLEGQAGVDTAAMRRWARWVASRVPDRAPRAAIDPINAYFARVLDCPRRLGEFAARGDTAVLDSVCNYR